MTKFAMTKLDGRRQAAPRTQISTVSLLVDVTPAVAKELSRLAALHQVTEAEEIGLLVAAAAAREQAVADPALRPRSSASPRKSCGIRKNSEEFRGPINLRRVGVLTNSATTSDG